MCSQGYEEGRTERRLLQGGLQSATDKPRAARPTGNWCGPRPREGRRRRPLVCRRIGRSHTHRIRVRYGECDPQGVVFNANYFAYFDIAITELWREALGGYSEMMEEGVDIVVAEATARFKAPARFDDELDLEITVSHTGTTSLVTAMRILRDGALLVEGEMVHVFVDRATLAKTPIPDRIRAALA
jgi:acyl-CoA thioester hydrolase